MKTTGLSTQVAPPKKALSPKLHSCDSAELCFVVMVSLNWPANTDFHFPKFFLVFVTVGGTLLLHHEEGFFQENKFELLSFFFDIDTFRIKMIGASP